MPVVSSYNSFKKVLESSSNKQLIGVRKYYLEYAWVELTIVLMNVFLHVLSILIYLFNSLIWKSTHLLITTLIFIATTGTNKTKRVRPWICQIVIICLPCRQSISLLSWKVREVLSFHSFQSYMWFDPNWDLAKSASYIIVSKENHGVIEVLTNRS